MFVAEGYVSLREIRDTAERVCQTNQDAAVAWTVYRRLQAERRADKLTSPTTTYNRKGRSISTDVGELVGLAKEDDRLEAGSFYLEVFSHAIRGMRNFYLVGPNTPAVRISREILMQDYLRKTRRYRYLSGEHLTVRVSGSIRVCELIREIKSSDWLGLMHFAVERQFDDTLSWESALRSLVAYEGCAVCVEQSDAPTKQDMTLAINSLGNSDTPTLGGRPRKQEAAAQAYRSEFPAGHVGYTWKEVLKRLHVEHGVHVSEDTLRSALKSQGLNDEKPH